MPMAVDPTSPLSAPLWSGRLVEWVIVLSVVLVLMGVFGRQVRVVQGQSELAALKTTLGALRTALVLDRLEQAVRGAGANVVVQQRNPFLLLKEIPANYAGQFGALQLERVAPGSWVFDSECSCIGYLPRYSLWLESPPDAQALWFNVVGAKGVLQIMPRQTYVWQAQTVN